MSPPTTYKDEEAKADISGHVNVLDTSSDDVSFTALVAEEGSLASRRRSSISGHYGSVVVPQRIGMGSRAHHHAVLAGLFFWITSTTMHKYIMKNPSIKDICDFGYHIFGKSRIAYEFSGCMLLANNILLIGFHILTGAKVINTLSDHSLCTVDFSVIVTIMGIVMSAPRTLKHVSFMSVFSAACMGIAILLFLVFAGVEPAPLYGYNGDYPTAGLVKTYAFPPAGTTWIACMNAVLNITFLWVPQILFPTFIAEMEHPEEFPKSLAVLTGISAILFIFPPAIGFKYLGQYATAPAFGSLGVVTYKKTSNTLLGWGSWIAVMAVIWWIGFVFAEIIPSMGDFLSLLGAAFDSFFGFIYFAVAYWHLYRGNLFSGVGRSLLTLIHIVVLLVGLFLLGPGLYAAVEAIIADYSGETRPAFSCANLAI
ncbi:N amino acid transport system protein [Diaporthe eres]|nr:N amino acid transport system protein [Diaporthe eres]